LREYQDIFQSALVENQLNCLGENTSDIVSIRQAKAALYAVSHHVPLSLDEDDGEALASSMRKMNLLPASRGQLAQGRWLAKQSNLWLGLLEKFCMQPPSHWSGIRPCLHSAPRLSLAWRPSR
jgi:hypothetical protein